MSLREYIGGNIFVRICLLEHILDDVALEIRQEAELDECSEHEQ